MLYLKLKIKLKGLFSSIPQVIYVYCKSFLFPSELCSILAVTADTWHSWQDYQILSEWVWTRPFTSILHLVTLCLEVTYISWKCIKEKCCLRFSWNVQWRNQRTPTFLSLMHFIGWPKITIVKYFNDILWQRRANEGVNVVDIGTSSVEDCFAQK